MHHKTVRTQKAFVQSEIYTSMCASCSISNGTTFLYTGERLNFKSLNELRNIHGICKYVCDRLMKF